MSVSFFPYPLQFGVLESFCHPLSWHPFARPAYHDGQALAGNGYILLRVHRGLWMPSDFQDPPNGFLTRFLSAPWKTADPESSDWRSLDEIKGPLFRFGEIGCWLNGKCAPSPVWHVGSVFMGRVSHLQLIARLPRCEVLPPNGRAIDAEPLHFRFSGGMGLLAHDTKLSASSFRVFQPQYCPLDGEEIKRSKAKNWNFGTPPPPEPLLDDWPPAEVSDDQSPETKD